MVEKSIVVVNESGLHARPASDFVGFVKPFEARVSLVKGDKTVNAKSILHVLSLSLKKGETFSIRVEGPKEDEVLGKIADFVANLEN